MHTNTIGNLAQSRHPIPKSALEQIQDPHKSPKTPIFDLNNGTHKNPSATSSTPSSCISCILHAECNKIGNDVVQ